MCLFLLFIIFLAILVVLWLQGNKENYSGSIDCTDLCSYLNPQLIRICDIEGNGDPGCQDYHNCINKCRVENGEQPSTYPSVDYNDAQTRWVF
jgi:hypothetical protein